MGKPESFVSVGWEASNFCVCGLGSKESMELGSIVLLLPVSTLLKMEKVYFVPCNWF